MNAARLEQSNADALPPPDASAGVDAPDDRIISPFRSPGLIQRAHRQPAVPIPRQLPLVGWRVPSDVAACLAASLHSRWQNYDKQIRECQQNFSEHSVHQLRVATRRLMTQFAMLSCAVPGFKAEKARRLLKNRFKLLGEMRDIQVQRMFIQQQIESFPSLSPVLNLLQQHERRLVRGVAGKIDRFKTRRLRKWTASLYRHLSGYSRNPAESERIAAEVFCTTAEAFAQVARRCQAIDPADSESIHGTRVAFKKFRYMIESLSPAFTGMGKRQLRKLGNYQRRMGALQDMEILQSSIAGLSRENEELEDSLAPFCRYLRRRRARILRSCLKHADKLFDFWPPGALEQICDSNLVRRAA